jgi:hypothetical protein
MLKDQNTQDKTASGSGKVDINVLAKELGTPEEFLQTRLTGEETRDEALLKLSKSTVEATKMTDQLKGEKSALLKERDSFRELAEKSLKQTTEPPTGKVGTGTEDKLTPEEEQEVEELLEMVKKADEIKKDITAIKKDLDVTKGEVSVTKNYALSQSAQIRAQKLREGKDWLKRTFGEQRANEYFNEDAPAKSPLGRFFDPSLCTDKGERALAEKLSAIAWEFENPVEMAIRMLAERSELGSAFSKQISETEGAGRSHEGGEVDKGAALKKEFLGIFK